MNGAFQQPTALANGEQAPEEPKGAENMLPNNNDAILGDSNPVQCSDAPLHAGPEAGQKRAVTEEAPQDEPQQKRSKTDHVETKSEPFEAKPVVKAEGGGNGSKGSEQVAAEDPPKPIDLPKPELKDAVSQLERVSEKKIGLGTRLEVCWEVVDDENEEEEEIPPIWWECEVKELVAGHAEYCGVWLLAYDSKVVDGKEFAAEERKVAFCAKNMLIDIESEQGSIGGGDKGLMQWRVEGSGDVLQPLLSRGSRVKARCRGMETWHAGVVFDVNHDGTYQISYDDGELEDKVVREHIEPVEGEEPDESEVVAEDIDSFFELFTAQLTAGAMFQALDPDKQRIASEKINSMRPLFREELEKIRDARGMGTTISGEDIAELIPKVMQRRAELDAAEKAGPVA